MKDKLKTVNLLFLLKTGIGSAIAILLAEGIGLAYSPSAGIITLLTIQNTKKETIDIALKRIGAFVLAAVSAYLVFNSLGYSAVAFGVFITLFVALCVILGLRDAIAMNAVLATHFLIEKQMGLPLILNETALLFIGMGLGIAINLIMPRNRNRIRREQLFLEEEMKKALRSIGEILKEKEKKVDFIPLDTLLEGLLKSAYEEAGNRLLSDTRYLVSYLEMRKLQVGVLKSILVNGKHIVALPVQAQPIADFMESVAASFHEKNNVEGLLAELEELKEYFRKEALPKFREEFENRAILFHIMKELEYFLMLKRNFIIELDAKSMKYYWN